MNARIGGLAMLGMAAACFEGGSLLGHPCESEMECGAGLVCGDGVCVDPNADDTTSSPSTTTMPSTSAPTSAPTSDDSTPTSGPSATAGTLEGTATSTATDTSDSSSTDPTGVVDTCSDGVVDGDEDCDDGNEVEGDGCDNDCSWTEFQIFVGNEFTCATLEDGRVKCWGANAYGQLGQGTVDAIGGSVHPWEVPEIMMPFDIDNVAPGTVNACGWQAGTIDVLCWGSGQGGVLGNGDTTTVGDNETLARLGALDLGDEIERLACGDAHCCALTSAAELRCWGSSNNGALGYGNDDPIGDDEPALMAGVVAVGGIPMDVCAGYQTCVILSDGSMKCWGYNGAGDLGNGNTVDIGDDELPSTVGALVFDADVVDIGCGRGMTCALLDNGEVRCWGEGSTGVLGQNGTADLGDDEVATDIAPIELGAPAVEIAVGRAHACALLDDQTLRCWGSNGFGQLGTGDTETIGDTETPLGIAAVDIGEDVLQVHAGGDGTCVRLANNRVKCWGANQFGQAGYASVGLIGDEPNEMPILLPDVQLFPPVD